MTTLLSVGLALGGTADVELIAEEMVVGAVGVGVPVAALSGDFEGGTGLVLGGMGGVGVGVFSAVWLNEVKKPTTGQAMAFTTSQLVLMANGAGWGYAVGLEQEAGALGLVGLGAGTGLGLAVMGLEPTAGEMATVRAGLLWGTLAGISVRFIDPRDRFWDVGTVMVGADLGLAAGLLLAVQPGSPTREQVVRVQVAGLGGASLGLATGLALRGAGAGNERTIFGGGAIGAAVGVGLGIANLKPLQAPGRLAVMPSADGATMMWSGRW